MAYRDHCDEKSSYLYKVYSFSNNIDLTKQFIEGLDNGGGGDICEAVFDGINQVINLDWTDGAADIQGGV